MKETKYKKTKHLGKMAIILNDHPHKNEVAVCLGKYKTEIGWGLKFIIPKNSVTFFVWDENDIRWLKE